MAGYNPIGLGNQPGDGLGDGGRTGGAKINTMFQELFYLRFVYTVSVDVKFNVERNTFDPADATPTNLKTNDRVSGFTDANKTRYVDGIILNATGFSIPASFDDATKWFSLIDKEIIS